LEPKIHSGSLNAEGRRFAIAESRWNELLTSKLTEGAIDALARLGAKEEDIEVFKVPGSFELPLAAKKKEPPPFTLLLSSKEEMVDMFTRYLGTQLNLGKLLGSNI